MSEAKFTKGHWKRCYHANGCQYVSADTGLNGCYSVASLHGPDDVANAHLIAAAPEMYEFIKTYMGGHPEAEELLAKARGEHE
jgi:hypothetical protein